MKTLASAVTWIGRLALVMLSYVACAQQGAMTDAMRQQETEMTDESAQWNDHLAQWRSQHEEMRACRGRLPSARGARSPGEDLPEERRGEPMFREQEPSRGLVSGTPAVTGVSSPGGSFTGGRWSGGSPAGGGDSGSTAGGFPGGGSRRDGSSWGSRTGGPRRARLGGDAEVVRERGSGVSKSSLGTSSCA